jgi:eukaryotic-like serine/threonine-protein kinase
MADAGTNVNAASGAAVTLDGRFDIFPSSPLPQYDSPSAKAYLAQSKRDPDEQLVAMILDWRMPPQIDVMTALRNFGPGSMVRVVEWGVVPWAPENRRLMAAVMERPGGDRVMAGPRATFDPFDEAMIVKGVLTPLLPVIRELQARGQTHRNIRPTNLFFTDGQSKQVMLGECYTAAPGLHQPHWVEPIESHMCDPAARGRGRLFDDIYSLGATILSLAIGRAPVPEGDAHQLLLNKINYGSYAALAAQHRISLPLAELLRGLLSDDVKERWTMREVELWMGGRRLSPKQPKLPKRSTRPFELAGREYFNARALAVGFATEWRTSAAAIRGAAFDTWLKRSLGDETVSDRLTKIANPAGAKDTGEGERLVTRACIALDAPAPLRFKGLALMPDGIGDLVASSLDNAERRGVISELFQSRLATVWLSGQLEPRSDSARWQQAFERMPQFIISGTAGYGMERCLYELNAHLPCQSPIVDRFYVTNMAELIWALNDYARNPGLAPRLIDRHLAAFCAVRCKQMSDQWLRPLADNEQSSSYRIGVLKIVALVQQVSKIESAPDLTKLLAEMLAPVVDSFHNLKHRKKMHQDLEAAGKTGQSSEILALFNDIQVLDRDEKAYQAAQASYQKTATQIALLHVDASNAHHHGREVGEQVAAIASGSIATLIASIIFLVYFL